MHPLQDLPIYQLYQSFEEKPSNKLAWEIIRQFYNFYQEKGAEDDLWFTVSLALLSDNEDIDRQQRGVVLFLFEYFKCFNNAVYYLSKSKI